MTKNSSFPKQNKLSGFDIQHFPELYSTQQYLSEQIQLNNLVEGTVVWADYQTNGYGKESNRWLSEQGANLTFSFLLRPTFLLAENSFSLTQSVALGISDFLLPWLPEVKVKWPNDIWINHRKICGFITDSQLIGKCFQTAVCGIGLNINQQQFCGEAIQGTSLALQTGQTYDLEDCLHGLLRALKVRYEQLKNGELETINRDYHERLFLKNIPHRYCYRNTPITATIIKVDSFGWLVLEDENKRVFSCDLGEIKLLP